MTETVASILAAHRAGTLTPAQAVARSFERIRGHDDPAVFISLRAEAEAIAEAEALATRKDAAQLPLLGIPGTSQAAIYGAVILVALLIDRTVRNQGIASLKRVR